MTQEEFKMKRELISALNVQIKDLKDSAKRLKSTGIKFDKGYLNGAVEYLKLSKDIVRMYGVK